MALFDLHIHIILGLALIRKPDLFWEIEHYFSVRGGEPTNFYLVIRRISVTYPDNIKWGIRQRAAQGTSKLYDRKCYGYDHDENGKLIINEERAAFVRKIFNWYLGGLSINGIIKELEKHNINSPTGKDKCNKHSLEVMLSIEKYKGAVRLFDDKKSEVQYLASANHPAIIIEEIFAAVQKIKADRSNVVVDENGQEVRKSTKYSSKKR